MFRNAMLLVIAGFPATFISMFFTGSLLIEVMFSLNGLGLLGYEATVSRDYPVMFGTLYIFTLIGLLLNIVSDISYTLVDPRIDFEDVNVATQPVNQARWARFRHNRRGYWSLWIFLVLFGLSLCSELIANDKPLLVRYDGSWYFPLLKTTAKAILAARWQVRLIIRTRG